jgi:FlaA1/EpsC-like NDP-sugar epimerase
MKHVPACEENPMDAVKTNVLGTQNVIDACKKHQCGLVLISTDKAVYPVSTMGVTKLLAERLVLNAGERVVRFGNVLKSRGSVIPFWESQAKEGKDVTITDKRMKRYFMSIDEAVDLIMWASEFGANGCVHLREMKELSIYDLAKEIADKHSVNVVETGIRMGEKVVERLITEEEENRLIKVGKFMMVIP